MTEIEKHREACVYYTPEEDNPYPLCIGGKLPECEDCCWYTDYTRKHGPRMDE